VAGQVGLAAVLLVGGGLLVESFFRANAVDPGYAPDNLAERSLRNAGGEVEAIVINEAMALALWPDADPLGKRLQLGTEAFDTRRFAYQVVGVVPDVRSTGLDEPAGPSFYVSDVSETMDLVVRPSVEAARLLPAIRGTLRELDPALPLEIRTARAELSERLAMRRFQAGLIRAFAIMALLLAAIGVYALLAYFVASRAREIGIRRALGAPKGATLMLVVRKCGAPVALGLGVGLLIAAAGARLLRSALFEVEPFDACVFGITAVVLLLAAAAASFLPALAATRIDPLEAVRADA